MKNNQIGIIGVGYWGTNIINTLIKLGHHNICCYDNNSFNLKEIKKKFPKIVVINRFEEFLKKKFNGVIIATSPKNHYRIAKACLNNNYNLFIEKPVTDNSEKLLKLMKLAKKKKKFIMSGYIYYYNQHIKYIKKTLSNNILGKILYISFERLNLGPIRNDISSAWDLTSHDISICNFFFKKKIKILNFSTHSILKKKISDISKISGKIGDIKVDFKSSWLHPEKVRKIIIVGKKKMLLYNEIDLKNPIKIFNKYAFYPRISKFSKKFFTKEANVYYGSTFSPKIISKSPLENEMIEFIKCCNGKKNPRTSTLVSLNILNVLESLH